MVHARLRGLAYPVTGSTRERPLLACWILVLLGFLVPVLPVIPLLGYLVRVLVRSGDGDTGPPPFLDAGLDLLRLGLGATLVVVGYLAIPLGLLLVTVNGVLGFTGGLDGFTGTVLFLAGSTTVFVISLLAVYALPVALVTYGRERRLRTAFDVSAIGSLVRRLNVFVGWAIGLSVVTVGATVASGLFPLSPLGPVVAALILAYALILGAHFVGQGIARAEKY